MILLCAAFRLLTLNCSAAADRPLAAEGVRGLSNSPPARCGTGRPLRVNPSFGSEPLGKKPPPPLPVLPAGMRMWQTIPGVVRNNGADTFRLEVNVNGVVSNVTIRLDEGFASQSGQTNVSLNDSGTNGDLVAGDGIYTSEPLHFDTNYQQDLLPYYFGDANSPAGIDSHLFVGTVTMTETNGTQNQFLINPGVGILNQNVPLAQTVQLSTNVVISPHLFNVLGTNLFTQKFLREYTLETGELPGKIYSVFPDAYDFFVYFSTYHIEYIPYPSYPEDGVAGSHQSLQINFTGTGQSEFNDSAAYGSAGRLLGINALDSYDRGVIGGILGHEILHQWGSYMPAFAFSDGEHYTPTSNAGSLLGGHQWIDNGDGTFSYDCSEDLTGPTRCDPLDQYLMGLIDTNLVATMHTYAPTSTVICYEIISNIDSTATIQDIVNTYGLRTPGPAASQKNFSIGFVAESYQRTLNPAEMTYYELLAAQFAKPLPLGGPDPGVGVNWPSFSRFFGGGSTWSSDVLSVIEPVIQSVQFSSNGLPKITAQGIPDWKYRLQGSTNLLTWSDITNQTAAANGAIVITDVSSNSPTDKFYRLVYP